MNTVASKLLYKNIWVNKKGAKCVSTVKEKFLKNVNEYSPCSVVVSMLLSGGSAILRAACWLALGIDLYKYTRLVYFHIVILLFQLVESHSLQWWEESRENPKQIEASLNALCVGT